MSSIKCENLSKSYKNTQVLRNINLEIEENKIYGLIGRNGVGKTTLLSMIAAHIRTSEGSITLDNEAIWENEKALSQICFSRELNPMNQVGTFGVYKVKDYLKMASIYLKNWDQAYADELVAKFELDVKKKMTKLSKGMLSMVTIIVALASKAKFTFLDEPVAGLDAVARDLFYQLLLDEYMESGRTFIVSTHILEEATNIFEEVIILKDKEILLKENTEELLARAFAVSGREDQVNEAVAGLKVYHATTIGRSKNVTVLLEKGQTINTTADVDVSPVSLQNLFVALCGKEV